MNEVVPTPDAVAANLRCAPGERPEGKRSEPGECLGVLLGWFATVALILTLAVAGSALEWHHALAIAVASVAVGALMVRFRT